MNKGTWIRVRSVITNGMQLLGLVASLGCATATAATLAPGVEQKLSSATFEVVLAKPVSDPLTYEKPLPLELIPYRERTDKFQYHRYSIRDRCQSLRLGRPCDQRRQR